MATVNPTDIERCMRCGEKALDKQGRNERLIQHHINYPLDITVPLCDSCHQEIHSGDDRAYLERYERDTSPYDPVGSQMAEGHAVHEKYREEPTTGESCPDCGAALIWPPDSMGFEVRHLCPNANCYTTGLSSREIMSRQ